MEYLDLPKLENLETLELETCLGCEIRAESSGTR